VTAARFMLDTDMCIYIRRKRPQAVMSRFTALGPGDAVISVVSYGELRVGAEKSRWRDQDLGLLEAFAAIVPVEPLPAAAGAVYARVRSELERRGEIIGNNDLWIAAHALSARLTLVTNNEREFRRVSGLTVENWAAT
jgi:tRNA(fMet)-specific endonuclease VapC